MLKVIISKKRICKEAENFGSFDYIKAYGPEDLDQEFSNHFKHILSQPKIGGYGIWRPYIIKKELDRIVEGDYLIYLDAGCTLVPSGKPKLSEYIEMLKNSDKGIISFQMPHLEKWYTTNEIFDHFHASDEIKNSGQYLDGILIMKKCEHLVDLIDAWLKSVYDNVDMFTDCYNNTQPDYFIDHRHEQSVFSVLRKIKGSIVINKDETWFNPFGTPESLKFPIWATRIRG